VTDDRVSNSQGVPEATDDVIGPVGGVWHNETLMSDPIDSDVGPVLPIDAALGGPEGESGAIDGLPGRYERQAQEDDEPGLDLTRIPLGETNG
jgi:hypothetical protein